MPRKKFPHQPPADRKPPKPSRQLPHPINPNECYSIAAFQKALGLAASTARREHREGRLRVGRRGGKNYILGKWIWEWLEKGELHRRKDRGGPDRAEGSA
jgi:hypothetical protein